MRKRKRNSGAGLLWLCLGAGILALIALVLRLAENGTESKPGIGAELPKRTQPPYTVVIDPGHGGNDVGAQDLVRESDTNWQTAYVLSLLLETEGEGRYNVVMTKEYEETMTPRQRATVAQEADADLFLSVHCNSASNPETKGFECYPVPNDRPWHDLSMEFGRLVAAQMGTVTELRGTEGLRYAYYVGDEKRLVDIKEKVPTQYGTFTVLEESGCPALLCEQCFVTNAEDAEVFGSESGAWLVARCYFNAVQAYFDGIEADTK